MICEARKWTYYATAEWIPVTDLDARSAAETYVRDCAKHHKLTLQEGDTAYVQVRQQGSKAEPWLMRVTRWPTSHDRTLPPSFIASVVTEDSATREILERVLR